MDKANDDFLEKIKTLTFGFGAKPDTKCPGCGQPMKDHHLKLVGIGVIGVVPNKPKSKDQPLPEPEEEGSESDEQIAFST